MTELKIKTKSYHTVDHGDLEEFIQKTTGHTYEIPCNEETGNDTSKTYRVEGFESDYSKQFMAPDWKLFKAQGTLNSYMLNTILNGLAEENLIPKGEYIVKICW